MKHPAVITAPAKRKAVDLTNTDSDSKEGEDNKKPATKVSKKEVKKPIPTESISTSNEEVTISIETFAVKDASVGGIDMGSNKELVMILPWVIKKLLLVKMLLLV